jgi:hypothetical protein
MRTLTQKNNPKKKPRVIFHKGLFERLILLEVNAKFGLRACDLVLGWWYIFIMFRTSVSFNGKFLPNFELKNMISTYTKDFSWEKTGPNLPDLNLWKFQIARALW